MEHYGIVRDGVVLWLDYRMEALRLVQRYGGRLICDGSDEPAGDAPAGRASADTEP